MAEAGVGTGPFLLLGVSFLIREISQEHFDYCVRLKLAKRSGENKVPLLQTECG